MTSDEYRVELAFIELLETLSKTSSDLAQRSITDIQAEKRASDACLKAEAVLMHTTGGSSDLRARIKYTIGIIRGEATA